MRPSAARRLAPCAPARAAPAGLERHGCMQPKPRLWLDVPCSLAVAARCKPTRLAAASTCPASRNDLPALLRDHLRSHRARRTTHQQSHPPSFSRPKSPSQSPQSRRTILAFVPSDICRHPTGSQARMALFATCQARARCRNEPSSLTGVPPMPPDACSTQYLVSHLALSIAAQSWAK